MTTPADTVAATARQVITRDKVLSYRDYYLDIRPKTYAQAFSGAIYAHLSPSTSAKRNSLSADKIISTSWRTYAELMEELVAAGTGLFKAVHTRISAHLRALKLAADNNLPLPLGHPAAMGIAHVRNAWQLAQARLDRIPQVGPKVAAMCLHLTNPLDCPLLILDRWFLQWYNLKATDKAGRAAAEQHWYNLCMTEGWQYPSIAREVYWDAISQKRTNERNNRWWAYPLERTPASPLVDFLRDIPYPDFPT